jgi:antitoxin (DNA-binding transcriptional repressor) of toxin-antitoxin stability system
MPEIEVGALPQHADAVVARAAAGEMVTITDRGRPVARMTAIPSSHVQALIEAGRARPARRPISELPAPEPGPGITGELTSMRDAERC